MCLLKDKRRKTINRSITDIDKQRIELRRIETIGKQVDNKPYCLQRKNTAIKRLVTCMMIAQHGDASGSNRHGGELQH